MTVIMAPVQSSNIKAIGYDALAFELHVEFKGGKTFAYKYVSSREFNKLLYAESVGKHINQFIKPDKVAFEIFDAKEEYPSSDELAILKSEYKELREYMLMIEKIAMHKPVDRAILNIALNALHHSEGKDNV